MIDRLALLFVTCTHHTKSRSSISMTSRCADAMADWCDTKQSAIDERRMRIRGTQATVRAPMTLLSWNRTSSSHDAGQELDTELGNNLDAVQVSEAFSPPIVGCKAVIAP